MNADKLHQIIVRKNEELEDNAVRTAEQLITTIAQLTAGIEEAQKGIQAAQKALKELEIQQLDPKTILGESEVPY